MNGLHRRLAWLIDHLTTLRVRLILWYVALLAVILVVLCVVLDASLATRLRQQLDSELGNTAQQLIATVDVQNGQVHLAENADNLAAGTVIALYSADGRHLLSDNAPAIVARVGPLPVADTSPRTVGGPGGQRWRVLVRPVVDGQQNRGLVLLARSEEQIDLALQQLILLEAVAIPVVLLLAIGGGLFLAGRALGPIDRITRTAEEIGDHDLSRRLALPPRQDEVGRLAATLDAMLDRLDGAFRRQRRFTADASHELRTPLTIIRSRAEVTLDRPRTAKEYREALSVIRDEATRLGQLVAELLTLARADAREEQLSREQVVLDDLVSAVVSQFVPLAEERQIGLQCGTLESVQTIGDPTRLAQLLINLVDNAMTYTPSPGTVQVDLQRRGSWIHLVVQDTGVGIAPEHLPHLFERFYRADSARVRGGAGLGLAICDWIASAHGGEIRVDSVVGKGSVFRVLLPAVQPAGPKATDRRSLASAARRVGEPAACEATQTWGADVRSDTRH